MTEDFARLRRGHAFGGVVNDPVGDLRPEVTYDINHHGSVRLARVAKDAGVPRFIFSSSCSLYGEAGDRMLDEQAAFAPVTPYGESKVWPNATSRCSPTSSSRRRSSKRHGLRLLSATPARRRGEQLVGHAVRPARFCCRATALSGAR